MVRHGLVESGGCKVDCAVTRGWLELPLSALRALSIFDASQLACLIDICGRQLMCAVIRQYHLSRYGGRRPYLTLAASTSHPRGTSPGRMENGGRLEGRPADSQKSHPFLLQHLSFGSSACRRRRCNKRGHGSPLSSFLFFVWLFTFFYITGSRHKSRRRATRRVLGAFRDHEDGA